MSEWRGLHEKIILVTQHVETEFHDCFSLQNVSLDCFYYLMSKIAYQIHRSLSRGFRAQRSPDGPTESTLGRKNTNRATVRSCNLPSEQPRFSVHLKEDEKLGRFPNRIIIPPRTGFQRWVRGSAGREEGEEDCTKPRTGRCHRPKFGTLSWAQMIRFQFWKRESS